MNSELYFPNGCDLCGSTVNLFEERNIYECSECGASVTYHHKETEFSKLYEPQGYLAGIYINKLRKSLKDAVRFFWGGKRVLQTKDGIKEMAPINVVYPKFLVKVDYLGDHEFGIPIDKKDEYTNVFMIDIDKHSMFEFSELGNVSNREKTYTWLAEGIGILAKDFKIGYLTKEQLLIAIELCHEQQRRIKAITVRDQVGYGGYSI